FGFGLGYTTFEFGTAHAPQSVTAGNDVVVHVPVKNTGTRTGREVVQVYLERTDSAVERPVRWLAGYAGPHLLPRGLTALKSASRQRLLRTTTAAGSLSVEPSGCWWVAMFRTASRLWESGGGHK